MSRAAEVLVFGVMESTKAPSLNPSSWTDLRIVSWKAAEKDIFAFWVISRGISLVELSERGGTKRLLSTDRLPCKQKER